MRILNVEDCEQRTGRVFMNSKNDGNGDDDLYVLSSEYVARKKALYTEESGGSQGNIERSLNAFVERALDLKRKGFPSDSEGKKEALVFLKGSAIYLGVRDAKGEKVRNGGRDGFASYGKDDAWSDFIDSVAASTGNRLYNIRLSGVVGVKLDDDDYHARVGKVESERERNDVEKDAADFVGEREDYEGKDGEIRLEEALNSDASFFEDAMEKMHEELEEEEKGTDESREEGKITKKIGLIVESLKSGERGGYKIETLKELRRTCSNYLNEVFFLREELDSRKRKEIGSERKKLVFESISSIVSLLNSYERMLVAILRMKSLVYFAIFMGTVRDGDMKSFCSLLLKAPRVNSGSSRTLSSFYDSSKVEDYCFLNFLVAYGNFLVLNSDGEKRNDLFSVWQLESDRLYKGVFKEPRTEDEVYARYLARFDKRGLYVGSLPEKKFLYDTGRDFPLGGFKKECSFDERLTLRRGFAFDRERFAKDSEYEIEAKKTRGFLVDPEPSEVLTCAFETGKYADDVQLQSKWFYPNPLRDSESVLPLEKNEETANPDPRFFTRRTCMPFTETPDRAAEDTEDEEAFNVPSVPPDAREYGNMILYEKASFDLISSGAYLSVTSDDPENENAFSAYSFTASSAEGSDIMEFSKKTFSEHVRGLAERDALKSANNDRAEPGYEIENLYATFPVSFPHAFLPPKRDDGDDWPNYNDEYFVFYSTVLNHLCFRTEMQCTNLEAPTMERRFPSEASEDGSIFNRRDAAFKNFDFPFPQEATCSPCCDDVTQWLRVPDPSVRLKCAWIMGGLRGFLSLRGVRQASEEFVRLKRAFDYSEGPKDRERAERQASELAFATSFFLFNFVQARRTTWNESLTFDVVLKGSDAFVSNYDSSKDSRIAYDESFAPRKNLDERKI